VHRGQAQPDDQHHDRARHQQHRRTAAAAAGFCRLLLGLVARTLLARPAATRIILAGAVALVRVRLYQDGDALRRRTALRTRPPARRSSLPERRGARAVAGRRELAAAGRAE